MSEEGLAQRIKQAVAEVVRQQADAGIDIVNDGEQPKRSWQTYAVSRPEGLEVRPGAQVEPSGSIVGLDMQDFPEYFRRGASSGRLRRRRLFPACRPCARAQPAVSAPAFRVGPLKYIGQAQVQTDIENMRAALEGVKHEEAVLTAIAGTDCGLGGRVGHAKLAWAKFEAMAEGARLASKELWAR